MSKNNLLDLVPYLNNKYTWTVNNNQNVEVVIKNSGVYNKIAQKLLNKPVFSYIELDGIGSYIWLSIDGKKTVYEIANMLKDEFKDGVDPLYERLALYLRILSSHNFIKYIK